jgi:hypothetical protein
MDQFFGKYRGKVKNNVDPMQLGRIQVSVPGVLGEGSLSWAMPCVPYAGRGVGFFAIPPAGANVWVEFECGDPDRPIWSGCFWGTGEVPMTPAVAEMKVFKTEGITLTLSDLKGGGGLTLEVGPPAVSKPIKVVCNSSGVEVSAAPAGVKITPKEIAISHGSATAKIAPSGLELKNGSASVKLTQTSVALNENALEVT